MIDKTFLIFKSQADAAKALGEWAGAKHISTGHYSNELDGGVCLASMRVNSIDWLEELEAQAAAGGFVLLPEMARNDLLGDIASHPVLTSLGITAEDHTHSAAVKMFNKTGFRPLHPSRFG